MLMSSAGPVHAYSVNVLKSIDPTILPPGTFSTPDARFDQVHINLFRPQMVVHTSLLV